MTATAGNDLTVSDSEINSSSTTLEAESIEIKDSNFSADQNLEIVAISGLDIASSTLDASDSIALQSYSIAIENTSVETQELAVDSTEFVQKESSFDADLYSVNNEESTNDGGDQDLGFAGNALLRSAGIQVNDSTPSQSNSELTMSLAGGVNYILDDSPQQSSSNEFQASTTTSSSNTNTTTAASTGSEEGSSSDNQSVSRDASSDSESESEQTKSRDDDQVGKEDKDSSKDQKSSRGLGKGLPAQKLTVKQTKQIHQESELQSSKFVASQLGLPERPAMTIQEIQGMLTSGMSLMNSTRQ